MLAAAYFCTGQIDKGLEGVNLLNQSELGPGLVGAFSDLADRLLASEMPLYARSVLEAAVKSGNRNEDIDRLLLACN
jgi:hypothetical protein